MRHRSCPLAVASLLPALGLILAAVGCSSSTQPASSVTSAPTTDAAATSVDPQSFSAIVDEYKSARDAYQATVRREAESKVEQMANERAAAEKALAEASNDDEIAAAQARLLAASAMPAMKAMSPADGPGANFAPRFLQFAVDHPHDADVVNSLTWAMRTSGGPKATNGIWHRALEILAKDHQASTELAPLVQLVADVHDDRSRTWLRSLIANHPDRKLQARAAKALGNGLVHSAEYGDFLKSNDAVRQRTVAQMGADYVQSLVDNAESSRQEGEQLLQRVRANYSDVLPDLSIGQPAPEIISKDLQDQVVKLSDLRGKIVVLDIWATWCGPCVAMIPHERELVQRLRGKPFALVSISADEEKSTLVDFLDKNDMPWTHWWNGRNGGLLEAWDIQYFPTIYVLDAKGTIRYTDVVGDELGDAIDALMSEMETSS